MSGLIGVVLFIDKLRKIYNSITDITRSGWRSRANRGSRSIIV